jgi:hypothetical protein
MHNQLNIATNAAPLHTACRFATGSKNRVEELHPHEWVQFWNEDVWMLWEGSFQCVKGVKVYY